MHSIDIDFEVFKALTARRETEAVTPNQVLRRVFGLDKPGAAAGSEGQGEGWTWKGVRFPDGTDFRARYAGRTHSARVVSGGLEINGKVVNSPSRAARVITGTSVNGWDFWECRMPGQAEWRRISSLRAPRADRDGDPFAAFSEWSSDADEAAWRDL